MTRRSTPSRFHVVTPVWGEAYVDLFLRVVLPSILTEGNLEGLVGEVETSFHLYTTAADLETLKSDRRYAALEAVVPTHVVLVEQEFARLESENKHLRMTACHQMAVDRANAVDAAIVIVQADAIYSEGSFATMLRAARRGKRAVMCTGIRVVKESFLPEWESAFVDSHGRGPAPARRLVAACLPRLHPLMRAQFVDAPGFYNFWPSNLIWPVDETGLLTRCFHLAPLMIWPEDKRVRVHVSMDADYMAKAVPRSADYHFVTDSDDMALVDLTPAAYFAELPKRERRSLLRIASFAHYNCDARHRSFLLHHYAFHSGARGWRWTAVIARSWAYSAAALALHRRSDELLDAKRRWTARFQGARASSRIDG